MQKEQQSKQEETHHLKPKWEQLGLLNGMCWEDASKQRNKSDETRESKNLV